MIAIIYSNLVGLWLLIAVGSYDDKFLLYTFKGTALC